MAVVSVLRHLVTGCGIIGPVFFVSLLIIHFIWACLIGDALRGIPGPKTFAFTKWRLAFEDWRGTRTRTIHTLHQKYGPVVRIGPNEVSFNSLSALRTIYGAGSSFERPAFYRMFDIYGRQHLFTFHTSAEHAKRKKLLNQSYSKSTILRGSVAASIESKVLQFLNLIKSEPETAMGLSKSLHYYAFDNVTWVVFGDWGATAALDGVTSDREILNDITEPTRRKRSWFQIHFPNYTSWAMSRSGLAQYLLRKISLLPGDKPIAYSGVQDYALQAWRKYWSNWVQGNDGKPSQGIMRKLLEEHNVHGKGELTDLDIVAECADHLDAGLNTTSDTLMFAIWALSLPHNAHFQQHLVAEMTSLTDSDINSDGIPRVEVCDRLPFLDAVIKETLRLYAPIPASQPRMSMHEVTIDGYKLHPGTIASCQAYSLHRNPEVFPDPLRFDPDRWLGDPDGVANMKRWWWPFSSGARMCIGMHLAMVEMKTLLAAVHRQYATVPGPGWESISPAITSRFELVYDDTFVEVKVGISFFFQESES
ncbi:hypothetical protein VTN00DRAFT_2401 [Thermoascus crustaceus]|uniref:uncharacterized protein n=1 Tax=Thermoascus crustaceus TaxID=5088 RepID=UPI003743B763